MLSVEGCKVENKGYFRRGGGDAERLGHFADVAGEDLAAPGFDLFDHIGPAGGGRRSWGGRRVAAARAVTARAASAAASSTARTAAAVRAAAAAARTRPAAHGLAGRRRPNRGGQRLHGGRQGG